MTEVRVREVPARRVVVERHTTGQDGLSELLQRSMANVSTAAQEQHGGVLGTAAQPHLERPGPDEPVFVVIYGGNPNEGPVLLEVCAPVAGDGGEEQPAHREAYVRVTKATVLAGELGGVYEAVEEWITANGEDISGPPRETYWTDFFGAAPGDEVFDVGFPIA